MKDIVLLDQSGNGLSEQEIRAAVADFAGHLELGEKTLLIPPDFTRMHSGAGMISQMLYRSIGDRSRVECDAPPWEPMSR